MPFNRALASDTWVALGLSAAFAQAPLKVPACSPVYDRRDMAGAFCAWAIESACARFFLSIPFLLALSAFQTDGSLGTGDCTLNDNFTLTQQPSGKLTIDRDVPCGLAQ